MSCSMALETAFRSSSENLAGTGPVLDRFRRFVRARLHSKPTVSGPVGMIRCADSGLVPEPAV